MEMAKLEMAPQEQYRVPPDRLRWTCEPETFPFATTAEIPPVENIIGQERAVRALDFGLTVQQPGYNIFITGAVGTGRTTYARAKVREVAERKPTPPDWCYVYNFQQPDQPVAISLPAGTGRVFQKDMADLVEELRTEIRRVFSSEEYERRRREALEYYETKVATLLQETEQRARERGFLVQRTPTGIFTIPLDAQGRPLSTEDFSRLPAEERELLAQTSREVQGEVEEALRRAKALEREARAAVRHLEEETGLFTTAPLIARLKEKYAAHPKVVEYLSQLQKDVLQNLDVFRDESAPTPPEALVRYKVNLLVDHAETHGAPLVLEPNPTYYNLFGKVEYRPGPSGMTTDFTMVKRGALHLANGGYLILHAGDLLANPFSWSALKRALKSQEIRIENIGEMLTLVPSVTIRPEPIPLNVKIVLIGSPAVYTLLYMLDEDFRKLFKVRADFDVDMPRTPENLQLYASAIGAICQRQNLLPFDRSGVAKVVEYSARLAEDQEKLSTRFNDVIEVIYEASAWAGLEGSAVVSAQHVRKAIEEKILRSNRIEERIREMIKAGQLLVDVTGAAVGQVNGLAVLNVGDYSFGKPTRITARTFVGGRGVINIEREAEMSGRIHSKGVFILASYVGGKYARDKPLSFSASLTFEQLYEEVEGDSAASAELYALLSDLAGVPIQQGIAVTGSVNQKGEIQPIGGVNEKIEGFYYVCKAMGLTGRQGVIIPAQNVRNLMLQEEVVEAVRAGQFHIWAVRTVEEGIEILTGLPAGTPDDQGRYPEDSIHGRVDRRLREMAERMRQFTRPDVSRESSGGTSSASPASEQKARGRGRRKGVG